MPQSLGQYLLGLLIFLILLLKGVNAFSSESVGKTQYVQTDSLQELSSNDLLESVRKLVMVDPEQALSSGLNALQAYRAQADTLGLANTWVVLGSAFINNSQFPEAISYLDSARYYFQIKKDSTVLNTVYNNLGVAYDYLGDYNKALNMYYRSLEMLKSSKDANTIVVAYNNIGLVLFSKGKYDEALNYYQRGIEIAKAHQLSQSLSYIFHNVAEVYFEKSDYKNAIHKYKESLNIDSSLKDEEGISVNLYSMAKVYLALKEYQMAEEYLIRSYQMQETRHDKIGMANSLYLLGSLWLLRNDHTKCLEYSNMSLEIAQTLGTKLEISKAAQQISQAYRAQADFENALLYSDLYYLYRDSLANEDINRQSALLKMQKQLAETSILEIENELKASMLDDQQLLIEKQTYLVIFISFGLIVSVVVLSLLFNANEDKYKTNQQLMRQKVEIEKIITELTELNENINEQKNELEKSNHVKDKLLSIVSHDFRSPLNSLEGMLDLVAEGNLSVDETKMIASELRIKVNITTGLLDNLLNWAKNQMQGIEVHAEKFDINSLTSDTIYLLSIQAERKNIRLINTIGEPIQVYADYEMIKLVVRNLVSNAIKFSEPGSEVSVDARAEGDRLLRFIVKDSGTGIPEEEINKLFTAEARSLLGTSNEKGTGLGLQLCRDFVNNNGGTIWVKSEVGIGSEFMFTVPMSLEKKKNEIRQIINS